MIKVQSFVEQYGGEQKIRQMKKDFNNTMKKGYEFEKK